MLAAVWAPEAWLEVRRTLRVFTRRFRFWWKYMRSRFWVLATPKLEAKKSLKQESCFQSRWQLSRQRKWLIAALCCPDLFPCSYSRCIWSTSFGKYTRMLRYLKSVGTFLFSNSLTSRADVSTAWTRKGVMRLTLQLKKSWWRCRQFLILLLGNFVCLSDILQDKVVV